MEPRLNDTPPSRAPSDSDQSPKSSVRSSASHSPSSRRSPRRRTRQSSSGRSTPEVLRRASEAVRRGRAALRDAESSGEEELTPDESEREERGGEGSGDEAAEEARAASPWPQSESQWLRRSLAMLCRRNDVLALLSLLLIILSLALQISSHPKPPLRQRAAAPPSPFFAAGSGVEDLFRGDGGSPDELVAKAHITLAFYYAPWCATSRRVRSQISALAGSLSSVRVVAVNCWAAAGSCRAAYKLYTYPVLALYHASPQALFYSGSLTADYLHRFVRLAVSPLTHLRDEDQVFRFLERHEFVVVACFIWDGVAEDPQGFASFHKAALRMLERDPEGRVRFALLNNATLARHVFRMEYHGEVHLLRHRGDSTHAKLGLTLPAKAADIVKAIVAKMDAVASWAGPVLHWLPHAELEGSKSEQLQTFLRQTGGPTVVLVGPRRVLHEELAEDGAWAGLKLVAGSYASCRAATEEETELLREAREALWERAAGRPARLAVQAAECNRVAARQRQLRECCQDVVLTHVPGAPKRNICDICSETAAPHSDFRLTSGLQRFLLNSGGSQSISVYDQAGKEAPQPTKTGSPAALPTQDPSGSMAGIEYSTLRSRKCGELEGFVSAPGLVDYCCHSGPTDTPVGPSRKPAGPEARRSCPLGSCSEALPLSEDCRRLRLAKVLGYPPIEDAEEAELEVEEDVDGFLYHTCYSNETLRFAALDSTFFSWLSRRWLGDLGLKDAASLAAAAAQPRLFIVHNATESLYTYPPLGAPPKISLGNREIRDFISNFSRGLLTRQRGAGEEWPSERRAEAAAVPERPVHWEAEGGSKVSLVQLTSANWASVMGSGKEVVLFYSGGAWCGACAGVFHVLLTAAAYFRSLGDRVVFAQLDASRNDLEWAWTVDRVPALLFVRPFGGQSAAFPASLPLSLPNVLAFVLANAGPEVRWRLALSVCVDSCLRRNSQRAAAATEALRREERGTRRRLVALHSQTDLPGRLRSSAALAFHRHLGLVRGKRRSLGALLALLGSLRRAGDAAGLAGGGREGLLLQWLIRNEWGRKPTEDSDPTLSLLRKHEL